MNTDNYPLPAATVIATSAGKSTQYIIIVITVVIITINFYKMKNPQHISWVTSDPYPQYPYPYTLGVFKTLAHH